MAQKVITELIDDLDGSEASQSLTFSLDGVDYAIDLTDENAAALRAGLEKFISAGRRTGGRKQPDRSGAANTAGNGPSSKDIRAWALSEGLTVSPRGRVQSDIVDQYMAAN